MLNYEHLRQILCQGLSQGMGGLHRYMELDLQSLFGLHVHSCTHWLRPPQPPPSPIWAHVRVRYWSAKLDDNSL